jgi:phenylalanyl-tRNA synthetase beta chain
MPVLAADYEELVGLIGQRIPRDELVARVPMMGGAYDGEDADGNLLFEFFPNRPDLLSLEGLARACRAFFDIAPGLPTWKVTPSKDFVTVDPSVLKIRPFIGFAIVKGIRLNEDRLAALIELQERLTVGPGRKRRKVAIGIHDAARVRGPFTYKAVGREDVRFVPLGTSKPMTPSEIFVHHEKGRLYAPLLQNATHVPLIVDAGNQVLSLPPVINGELTALTTRTTDVIVDVTGTDDRAVQGILAIVVTSLADRGGQVESLEIRGGSSKIRTPNLTPIETQMELSRAQHVLGLPADVQQARQYLGRMGHEVASTSAGRLTVRSPAYRMDLLHPDDLVEDLGIGYGFEKFEPRLPERALFGGALPRAKITRRARTILMGLGFTEVVTLNVTSKMDAFERMGAPEADAVAIANPITLEQAILRPRLVPGLLSILRANKQRELPQSIFEAGLVVPDPSKPRNQLRIAGCRISANAGFSECKGIVEAFLRDAGIQATFAAGNEAGFIPGRSASLRNPEGIEFGWFGELRPDVITSFELGAPTIAFEIVL